MKNFEIGIDNYGLYPLALKPLEILTWANTQGAAGVAFSGLEDDSRKLMDREYLRDIRQYAEDNDMYLEWGGGQHIPRDMNSWEPKDILKINEKAAVEAEILGTRIVRSCSGGLMRWNDAAPMTETLLRETAETLKSQKAMLKDYNVMLAIETHFEFTTFEHLRLFDYCDAEPGEYLGICLDTMNLLTMLEEPVSAVRRILPWVVSTHIKDGALLQLPGGMKTFTCGIGKGIVDLKRILRLISTLDRKINLSIEDHGGDFDLPVFDPLFMAKFPDLTTLEYAELIELAVISGKKVESGECNILPRDRWPEICERRLFEDIKALKEIVKAGN